MCRVAGGLFSLSRDRQGEKLTALYNHCHIYGIAFQFLLLLSTGVHFFHLSSSQSTPAMYQVLLQALGTQCPVRGTPGPGEIYSLAENTDKSMNTLQCVPQCKAYMLGVRGLWMAVWGRQCLSGVFKHAYVLSRFSCVQLVVTLQTTAHLAPLSMGFSRQEYLAGFPCSPPGDLPDPWIKPASLTSPALAGRFFTTSTTWEAPPNIIIPY